MAWALLGIAGIFEIAFALGMKSSAGFTKFMPAVFTVVTGLSSVYLLSLSLRTLPVGTAYAVWTGIGAAGTAILGMMVARTVRRKANTTSMTRKTEMSSVISISRTEARMVVVRSITTSRWIAGEIEEANCGMSA